MVLKTKKLKQIILAFTKLKKAKSRSYHTNTFTRNLVGRNRSSSKILITKNHASV